MNLSRHIQIDEVNGIITIYGIRYHESMFRGLGIETRPGRWIRILERDDGVITLQERPEEDGKVKTALEFYANQKNYQSPSEEFLLQYDPEPSPIENDQGSMARKALEWFAPEEVKPHPFKRPLIAIDWHCLECGRFESDPIHAVTVAPL